MIWVALISLAVFVLLYCIAVMRMVMAYWKQDQSCDMDRGSCEACERHKQQ